MTVRRWVWLLSLLALPVPALGATQEVRLADPGAAAQVVFRVPYAVLEVVGSDRDGVRMTYDAPEEGDARVHLRLTAQGNRVEAVDPGNAHLLKVRIEVPRRTDLRLETSNGGPLRIVGVEGVLEVVNSNAGVELTDVAGSIAVSTSNGPIVADVTRVDPGGTVSLVTSNGRIEVTLPADFAGRVLAESDTGPIESDFRVRVEAPRGLPRPGRVLSGQIGSGAGLLRLRTNNAGIQIHRR